MARSVWLTVRFSPAPKQYQQVPPVSTNTPLATVAFFTSRHIQQCKQLLFLHSYLSTLPANTPTQQPVLSQISQLFLCRSSQSSNRLASLRSLRLCFSQNALSNTVNPFPSPPFLALALSLASLITSNGCVDQPQRKCPLPSLTAITTHSRWIQH